MGLFHLNIALGGADILLFIYCAVSHKLLVKAVANHFSLFYADLPIIQVYVGRGLPHRCVARSIQVLVSAGGALQNKVALARADILLVGNGAWSLVSFAATTGCCWRMM